MSDPLPNEPSRPKRAANPKLTPSLNTQQAPSDWKNHPVLVVGGAVVATALTCLTYFNQFALPQRTARLEDSAFRANEQLEKLKTDIRTERDAVAESHKTVKKLEDKRLELSRLLSEARTSDMFLYKTAYPNGFASVKIGMTAADVHKAYPKTAIEQGESGYLDVKLANSPFKSLTYYFNKDAGKKDITHILVMLNYTPGEPPSQDIVKRLTESLGKPLHIAPKYYAWPTADDANVFVKEPESYIVMREGYRPVGWPTEKEKDAMCEEIQKNQCPIPAQNK